MYAGGRDDMESLWEGVRVCSGPEKSRSQVKLLTCQQYRRGRSGKVGWGGGRECFLTGLGVWGVAEGLVLLCCCARTITGHVPGEAFAEARPTAGSGDVMC